MRACGHHASPPRQELQALLDERGVVCSACAEKADLIKRVQETYHLPLKSEEKKASAESSAGPKYGEKGNKDFDDDKLEELLSKMGNGPNGQKFKVFRPDVSLGCLRSVDEVLETTTCLVSLTTAGLQEHE